MRINNLTWAGLAAACLCLAPAGCGGGADEDQVVTVKRARTAANGETGGGSKDNGAGPQAAGAAEGKGTFKGRVVIKGTPPSLPPLVAQGQAVKDAEVCAVKAIPDETVVSSDGGLGNVFIYLRRAPSGWQAGGDAGEEQEFDQVNCTFVPHAIVVRTGEPGLLCKSSDSVAHNVKTSPALNPPFNATLEKTSKPVHIVYDKPEPQPVRVECNFHNWMKAFQLPLDHPFGTVTQADGSFTIENLPTGKHQFAIWHEGRIIDTRYSVEIKTDGEVVEKTIEIDAGTLAALPLQPVKVVRLSLTD